LTKSARATFSTKSAAGRFFISCCEEDRLAGLEEGAAFHIRSGAAV
jgi:hypothetical protein